MIKCTKIMTQLISILIINLVIYGTSYIFLLKSVPVV